MSSKTKRRLSTKCGKRILPTSKSLVRVGIICPRSWTITAAISSPLPGRVLRSNIPRGWKLCTNMRAEDVTDTLDLALEASGCGQVHVVHKPRLLSDRANGRPLVRETVARGSGYVSGDLAEWLPDKGMKHSRGAPYHPQTQGKHRARSSGGIRP